MPAPKVTWRYLEDLIAGGHGTGFGEKYQPFLKLRRWNPSSASVQILRPVPPFRRNCHFFSKSEYLVALAFSWAGAEIREQFPAWPWPHPHPQHARKLEWSRELGWSRGMEAICRDAGIKHGNFIGTKIPYIWTFDLEIYLPWANLPSRSTCLISVKPLDSERFRNPDPVDRALEKLEGERLYALELGISYFVADRSQFPDKLLSNLDALSSAASLPTSHPLHQTLDRFLQSHGHRLQELPPSEILEILKTDFKVSHQSSCFLKDHLHWHQIIDVDLSSHVRENEPPKPGGRALRSLIREKLNGGRNG